MYDIKVFKAHDAIQSILFTCNIFNDDIKTSKALNTLKVSPLQMTYLSNEKASKMYSIS